MKALLFLVTSLLLSFNVQAEEPNTANGQRLFKASRCLECHSVGVFTSKDRKVKDLAGLERKVRQCDANLSTNWFDDQILDVVAYLNSTYYKFKPVSATNADNAELLTPLKTAELDKPEETVKK
uniref:Cytochrome c domain-containing protein n=1 Tax=uncultured Thiotrichaceae bacterium TaxID=298394 RepID=A0A6S6UKU7_9GAMM|nr:MAG: Unknown protein [uncultured Thiotrichaceae bacterium]